MTFQSKVGLNFWNHFWPKKSQGDPIGPLKTYKIVIFRCQNFLKILLPEKHNLVKFSGTQWVPPVIFLAKNGSKSSVLPWIEKSWPFRPQKIAFKMSYGCFPLGGAFNAPLQIGLTTCYQPVPN